MADEERETEVYHPNREKSSSQLAKFMVALLLLVSAGLVALVTFGGWEKLVGARAVQIGFIIVYAIMAFFALRWSRGVLPLAAALGIILAIFAGIAAPEWFERSKDGFGSPLIDENILGLLTILIIPVQVALIIVSLLAFRQEWNVEEERPVDEGRENRGDRSYRGEPAPA
jgi:hypothetical protein